MADQDAAALVEMEKARAYEACRHGDLVRALEHARRALQLALEDPNPIFAAGSLDVLGDVLQRRGECEEARRAYSAALDLYRQVGSQIGRANVELSLGHLGERLGDLAAARRHYQAARDGYAHADRPRGQGQAHLGLGVVAMREGNYEQAVQHYAVALELSQRLGDLRQVTEVRFRMGQLVTEADPGRAVEEMEVVLRAYSELKDPLGMANVHAGLARARAKLSDFAGAHRHLREAIALYEKAQAHRGRAESWEFCGDLHVANHAYVLALEAFHRAKEAAQLAGLPGVAAWMSFRAGCMRAAGGHVAEGLAAAEAARRVISGTPQCDQVPKIDEWIARARLALAKDDGGQAGSTRDGVELTSLEKQALQLVHMAQAMMIAEQFEHALEKQMAAESILRTLKRDHPQEPQHAYELASLLYAKSSCLHFTERSDDAMAALDESQRGYTELRDAGCAGMDRLIADVRARRGRFEATRGRGASAIVETDAATTTYLRLQAQPGMVLQLPDLLDRARILSANALALVRYGDPDLAAISADHAIAIYLTNVQAINASPPSAHMHMSYLCSSAGIATEIHAVHGRLDIAIQAADIYAQIARTRAQNESAHHTTELARALAWKGLIWQARGGGTGAERCLAEAYALDSLVMRRVEQAWQETSAGRHPLRNTLASALKIAARDLGSTRVMDLVQALVVPPTQGGVVFTPSSRCSSEEAVPRARELAELAMTLFPSAPDAALRLGLEAHYLFSASSRESTAGFGSEPPGWEIPWARVLLACSRDYRDQGDLPMALDLSDRCIAVARQLVAFARSDPALPSILDEIERHHSDLGARAAAR
jgi:tetratricopeptide (TPR) repeat protein